nr:hypothetical protein L204_04551 [Cryptococcus depauperatus CBS 7855]
MSPSRYREPITILSDSEDEAVPLKATQSCPQNGVLAPNSIPPRIAFSNKTPLAPCRAIAFVPTPVKRLNFSNTKIKGTPSKKIQDLKFVKLPILCPDIINDCEQEDMITGLDTFELVDASENNDRNCERARDFQFPVNGYDGFSSPNFVHKTPIQGTISPQVDPVISNIDVSTINSLSPICLEQASATQSFSDESPVLVKRLRKARLIVTSDSDEAPSTSTASRKAKMEIKQVIDLTTSDDDEELSENQGVGAKTYYDFDDSYGSLKDFIVDDSDGDNYTEASSTSQDDSNDDAFDLISGLRTIEKVLDSSGEEERTMEKEWDAHNNDILHYSPPRRPLVLPNFEALAIASGSSSDSNSEPPLNKKFRQVKTPSKSLAGFSKKEWASVRVKIAQTVFDDLDTRVFESKLGTKGVGARIMWNNRLLTTAGMARMSLKEAQSKEHWIELSEKVLTGEERIKNTVAHEMCHLATWIISGDYKNPHGAIFKSWGRKVMAARQDIETKHSYSITYKYEWKCSNQYCGQVYKRHSKSIDVAKHACGSCRSKLTPLLGEKRKAVSGFQLYLKENMRLAKTAMLGAAHGEIMRALSQRWAEAPEATKMENEAFWKNRAA